jgi:hypothetical protein
MSSSTQCDQSKLAPGAADHLDLLTNVSSLSNLLRRQAAGLQTSIGLLPTSSASRARHGSDSCQRPRFDFSETYAKCYFQLKIFFRRPTLHVFLLFRSLPFDMLGGLAMSTRRSPDLRVQIFYLVLCSPPPRRAQGLDHANLRVSRPERPN